MNSSNGEQRFDEDILQSKAEILRLKGLVPPFGRPPKRDPDLPADNPESSEPFTENTLPPEPIEADEPTPTETTAVGAADQLYGQLQEPPKGPEIEMDWSPEEVETASQHEENPMAETTAEEIAELSQVEEEKLEAELNGDGADKEEEGGFRAENSSLLALIEKEAAADESQPEPEETLEMPSFDLAQQIMAEQRKITRNRRKGPGSPRFDIKEEKPTPTNSIHPPRKSSVVAIAEAPMSPQQRVIAEIVARDIRKHYQASKVR